MKNVSIFLLQALFFFNACSNTEKSETNALKSVEPINRVVGIARIEPQDPIIQLSTPVNGVVKKIWKSENDDIKTGTVILELDHELEDAKILQQQIEVSTQTKQLKADRDAVSEYLARYDNAVSEYQHLKSLYEKGAEIQQNIDKANTEMKSLKSNLNRFLSLAEVSESKLIQSKASLRTVMIERDQKIIKSPVKGTILEINAQPGEFLDNQQSFAQIRPEGKIIAVCEIDEINADKITNGQKAWIRNVGAADTLTTGNVYFISSFLKKKSLFTDQSGEKEDRRVRTIKVMLDNPEHLLLNERVECVVDISGKPKN